ncbi:hypothetical protein NKDENANG_03700 [Candidatus Entotheonellaceae bacterium PAL068K]
MAKKKQALDSRLGSWTDQARLTRTQPLAPEPAPLQQPAMARRQEYRVARSLMDRIAETAKTHSMTRNELVGYLLTWSLDQIDAGAHDLPSER